MILELRTGIQLVKEDFGETFASLPINQITFEHLWTLYPPNTIVWCRDTAGNIQAYKVRKNHPPEDEKGSLWLILNVDYID